MFHWSYIFFIEPVFNSRAIKTRIRLHFEGRWICRWHERYKIFEILYSCKLESSQEQQGAINYAAKFKISFHKFGPQILFVLPT